MRVFGKVLFAVTAVSVLTLGVMATEASAKPRKKVVVAAEQPLVVKHRSFLELGKVVRVGSQSNYVQQNTVLRVPDQAFTGKFGTEALPRRFDLPGSEPLFRF